MYKVGFYLAKPFFKSSEKLNINPETLKYRMSIFRGQTMESLNYNYLNKALIRNKFLNGKTLNYVSSKAYILFFIPGWKRFMPGWFWRTFNYESGRKEHVNRTCILGNRVWKGTPSWSLYQYSKIRTVDRQSHELKKI